MPNVFVAKPAFNPELEDAEDKRYKARIRKSMPPYLVRQDKHHRRLYERIAVKQYAQVAVYTGFLLAFFTVLSLSQGTIPLPQTAWTYQVWADWTLGIPWKTFASGGVLGALGMLFGVSVYGVFKHYIRLRRANRDAKE